MHSTIPSRSPRNCQKEYVETPIGRVARFSGLVAAALVLCLCRSRGHRRGNQGRAGFEEASAALATWSTAFTGSGVLRRAPVATKLSVWMIGRKGSDRQASPGRGVIGMPAAG